MVIEGRINELGEAALQVVVSGIRAQAKVDAVIDTGFSGELCLPIETAIQLGLELCGIEFYELADGAIQRANVFKAKVEWFSKEREVEVVLTESPQALVGTGMLMGKKVELDFDRMAFIVKEQ
jgi:clan AA aspartic protease